MKQACGLMAVGCMLLMAACLVEACCRTGEVEGVELQQGDKLMCRMMCW
jgi:hypothetical protein